MGCNLSGETLGGQGPFQIGRRGVCGRRGCKIGKRALGASQVARCGVEDGVLLCETRSPAASVVEVTLSRLGSFEDGARENGGGWGLFGCGRLSVWVSKAVSITSS